VAAHQQQVSRAARRGAPPNAAPGRAARPKPPPARRTASCACASPPLTPASRGAPRWLCRSGCRSFAVSAAASLRLQRPSTSLLHEPPATALRQRSRVPPSRSVPTSQVLRDLLLPAPPQRQRDRQAGRLHG
jgi:hypothetical protein